MASNSQTSPTWIIPVQEQREPPWAMDLVNGGPKSLAILLDWLSTGDNYTQWVTTGVRDPKREDVCLDVVARMQQHGIRHRTAMGVNRKIQLLRRSFNTAQDFVDHARGRSDGQDPIIQREHLGT
ncbi:hypothetical protein PGT21_011286 [Puccinia graminis f. sp. tritici]|uniref:Uncharacterized protein n=1 Tax=Puccinia graminis f. sp. tritici TaxID=56615 RepID=A0A5B0PA87_PUCGR|nr:hypothetical protein PGT21_011286 [Puccinia graminis f. sp. tritici]